MKSHDIRWTDSPLEHFVAIMFLLSAFAVLFPWGLPYYTSTVNISEDQIIDPDVARAELGQLSKRIDEPGFTTVIAHQVMKRARYIERHTPWIPKASLAKVEKNSVEHHALEMRYSSIFRIYSQIIQNARDKFRTDVNASEELRRMAMSDPEFQSLTSFRATDTIFHWEVISNNMFAKLPFAFALALLYFIAMIKARELDVAVELKNPFSLILATATFPVSWLIYPYKDPRQQVSRVVNIAGMVFSFLMTFSGMAIAQTVKKVDGKKKRQEITLQTYTRAMIPLVDDPQKLTLFNRTTLDLSKGVVENITLAKPSAGTWYTEMCGGPSLGHIPKTKIFAVGCATKSKGVGLGWTAGIQVFRPFGKRFFVAVPVARMEGKTFNLLGSVSAKIGKNWSLVPEGNFKITPGKQPAKSVVIALRRSFGHGSAEAGVMTNGVQHTLRPRLIHNSSF